MTIEDPPEYTISSAPRGVRDSGVLRASYQSTRPTRPRSVRIFRTPKRRQWPSGSRTRGECGPHMDSGRQSQSSLPRNVNQQQLSNRAHGTFRENQRVVFSIRCRFSQKNPESAKERKKRKGRFEGGNNQVEMWLANPENDPVKRQSKCGVNLHASPLQTRLSRSRYHKRKSADRIA